MKIKLSSSDSDLYAKKSSKINISNVQKTLDLIEDSIEFQETVAKIRKKYGINKDWFIQPINRELVQKWEINKQLEFDDECINLSDDLNLPLGWWPSILDYITFNTFFSPLDLAIEIISPNEEHGVIHATNRVRSNSVLISINQPISRERFKQWLKDNFDEIEKRTKNLPKQPWHKKENTELTKEIVELWDSNKYKEWKDLSNYLYDKYQGNEEILAIVDNVEHLNTYYTRWKKRLKKEFQLST